MSPFIARPQSLEPISDEALRRLRDAGCNPAELAAYAGITPHEASQRAQAAVEAGKMPLTIGQLGSARQIQAEFGVSRATAYRWKATHTALMRRSA